MIWNEESVDVISVNLDELIAASGIETVYEDAPSYIFGKNWTDELRIKNGFTLINNEWKKVIIVKDYWSTVIHDIKTLLKEKSRLSEDLHLQSYSMLCSKTFVQHVNHIPSHTTYVSVVESLHNCRLNC